MSVNEEPSGRRSVEIDVEVHGTPEEVWQAIATGAGVSSWFMPTTVEEQDGKPVSMTISFGPGMESRSVFTDWNPPHTLTRESPGWVPGSPPIANEWIIEAQAGGTCKVRIVHSLFASTDDWDGQLEATKYGWPAFLRTLQLYLEHFRGQRSTLLQAAVPVAMSEADAWATLLAGLQLSGFAVGQQFAAPDGAPALRGVLEYVTTEPYDALVRVAAPSPGIAAFGVSGMPGGPIAIAMNVYLYGEAGAVTAEREGPQWQAWLASLFPMPAAESQAG